MLEGSVEIDLEARGRAEHLTLLHERAVWWGRTKTLFVADVHMGKAAAFRAWGAPVPEEVTRRDLARLSALVEELRPARVIVLGDLLHAPAGMTPETIGAMARWREGLGDVPLSLVRGNHDRKIAADSLGGLGLAEMEPGETLNGVRLLHDPADFDGQGPALAGHLHPGVVLRPSHGAKGAGLRAPCFWLRRSPKGVLLVLPAFGTFTGLLPIRATAADRVFAVGPQSVVEVGGSAAVLGE